MKKIYSLGASCLSTEICQSFDCEHSFFDWAITPCIMNALEMILSDDSIRLIIEGQQPYSHPGKLDHEFNKSQFIISNIIFPHYKYKDINDATMLVKRLCRIKNAFGDFENNYFLYTITSDKDIYKPYEYPFYTFNLSENFAPKRMLEDNVIILNPFGLDIPYLKDFKHIYTNYLNIEFIEKFKEENKNTVINWARELLLRDFPALYEVGRTQKTKTNLNQLPAFFYDVYNSNFDYDEFLYNINNLGIIKYLLEKNYEVESNRNGVMFYNKYFHIAASNLTELWTKISEFCQRSVDFTDNFCF